MQHDLMHAIKRHPDKIALIISEKSYSYLDIYQAVIAQSNSFHKMGLKRGDRVLILSGNTYLSIVSIYAALFCDAVPCVVDNSQDKNILQNILQSINPYICVVLEKDKDNVFFEAAQYKTVFALSGLFRARRCQNTEDDLAMIVHTSGSTGIPKGVMLSHRNVCAAKNSIQAYLNLLPSDTVLSALPLHFDYGLYQLFLSVQIGATLVLQEDVFFPLEIMRKVEKYQVTVFPLVPYLMQLVWGLSKRFQQVFPSVRMVTNTGEVLTKKHIDQIRTVFPNAAIYSMYGLTECKRCSYVPPDSLINKYKSIGIPMPNLEMWVADSNGKACTPNTEGELLVSGPTVMLGYWKDEKNTADKIKYIKNKKILYTGDRAFMDHEGFFTLLGRGDGQIKYKGAKFISSYYLNVLNKLSFIHRALFFNQDDLLILCVESSSPINRAERTQINDIFPDKQKPSFVYVATAFPALTNGKIDQKKLKKIAFETYSLT